MEMVRDYYLINLSKWDTPLIGLYKVHFLGIFEVSLMKSYASVVYLSIRDTWT
jgi:hypothetical protein